MVSRCIMMAGIFGSSFLFVCFALLAPLVCFVCLFCFLWPLSIFVLAFSFSLRVSKILWTTVWILGVCLFLLTVCDGSGWKRDMLYLGEPCSTHKNMFLCYCVVACPYFREKIFIFIRFWVLLPTSKGVSKTINDSRRIDVSSPKKTTEHITTSQPPSLFLVFSYFHK